MSIVLKPLGGPSNEGVLRSLYVFSPILYGDVSTGTLQYSNPDNTRLLKRVNNLTLVVYHEF